jgi:hypothetical protein
MLNRSGWTGLAVLVTLGILAGAAGPGAAQQAADEDPLAGLEVSAEGVGWSGVHLGMSLVQAERRFGTTLALEAGSKGKCGKFVAGAERDGLNLSVGFASPKPGAKIETLYVQFEGYQVAADAQHLIASLRRKAPEARYLADPDLPDRNESNDPSPKFEVDGKIPVVIHLRTRDGLMISRRDCVVP